MLSEFPISFQICHFFRYMHFSFVMFYLASLSTFAMRGLNSKTLNSWKSGEINDWTDSQIFKCNLLKVRVEIIGCYISSMEMTSWNPSESLRIQGYAELNTRPIERLKWCVIVGVDCKKLGTRSNSPTATHCLLSNKDRRRQGRKHYGTPERVVWEWR